MIRTTFYTTSCPTTLKTRTDITTLKHILDAKKVDYEEVDLSEQPQRRQEMLDASDGNITIPQLHVNGRFIGTVEEVQEYEDFGELSELLKGTSPTKVLEASLVAATAAAAAAAQATGQQP